ncbi:hypothetical protein [Rhodococcus sp. MEB041]|nr:hypothetical protein [Rhodococcus sp. MEB041]
MNVFGWIAVTVLVLGVVGVVISCWPTRAERAFGYPHDSAEARMLRGER